MKKMLLSLIVLSCLLLAAGCMIPGAAPKVTVTDKPPADQAGYLSGKVEGVRPLMYEVFVFLHVSNGWWYKPYFGERTTISLLGTWSCDVATGGIDIGADQYAVYLVPRKTTLPSTGGADSLPDIPEAADTVIVNR